MRGARQDTPKNQRTGRLKGMGDAHLLAKLRLDVVVPGLGQPEEVDAEPTPREQLAACGGARHHMRLARRRHGTLTVPEGNHRVLVAVDNLRARRSL